MMTAPTGIAALEKRRYKDQEIRNFVSNFEAQRDRAINGIEVNGEILKMQLLHRDNAKRVLGPLLTDDQIQVNDRFVRDPKGESAFTKVNRLLVQMGKDPVKDATAFFHPNEVTTYQKLIQKVLRWGIVQPDNIGGSPFWPEEDIGRGMITYKWFKFNDIPAPATSVSFEGKAVQMPTTTDTDVNLLGFYYDYHLSMPQRDASMSTNSIYQLEPRKQQAIIQELTKSLVVYNQYYRYRGTSIPGVVDLGYTGLVNDSNVSNQTTIGNAGSLTTYGNILSAVNTLINTCIAAKRIPPFVVDLTPGVFMQANKNRNSTTGRTELMELFDLTDNKKQALISAIRVNPFLIAGASETNTTAAIAVFKPGEEDWKYVYSYPLAFYPLPPTTLGVDGKILCMGRTVLEQASAVAYGGSLTVDVF